MTKPTVQEQIETLCDLISDLDDRIRQIRLKVGDMRLPIPKAPLHEPPPPARGMLAAPGTRGAFNTAQGMMP